MAKRRQSDRPQASSAPEQVVDEIVAIDQQTRELRRMELPPNYGDPLVPHILTFGGLLSSAANTYRPSDEALKASWESAQNMRNDALVSEAVELRRRATALLGWHIEAEDPEDPVQREMVDTVSWLIDRIPRFTQYRECLLDALWYGRYACENTYRWTFKEGRRYVTVARWRPVHGDKLVWRFDDDSGAYDPDAVGVRIGRHSGITSGVRRWERFVADRGGEILPTHAGLAYFPPEHLREQLVIHRHMIEDGEYMRPEDAGRVFGVGIRSKIYWTWYQKQDALAWLMEYLERSAFGIEIWYYPAGSAKAKEDTITAASERIGNARNVLVVPRPAGPEAPAFGVERLEPGMQGAQALKEIITEYFGAQIKRYILGQTLTTEQAPTGLGSNLASIHLDTFLQIVRYDALNLEETLTDQLVARLVRYNWPSLRDCPLRFRIETETRDPAERLEAIERAWRMGLAIRADDIREMLGLAKPGEDEESLQMGGGGQDLTGQVSQQASLTDELRRFLGS